jgi:hypothetical protein
VEEIKIYVAEMEVTLFLQDLDTVVEILGVGIYHLSIDRGRIKIVNNGKERVEEIFLEITRERWMVRLLL